jgi:hypothetical protein
MIVDEKRREQLKSDLAEFYSDDAIELLISAANSAERYAFDALTMLEGWLEELGPDRPSPELTYELARLQLDAVLRPVYDSRPDYGCPESVCGIYNDVLYDVESKINELYGWVPRKLAEHVRQAEVDGTYKFLRYYDRK